MKKFQPIISFVLVLLSILLLVVSCVRDASAAYGYPVVEEKFEDIKADYPYITILKDPTTDIVSVYYTKNPVIYYYDSDEYQSYFYLNNGYLFIDSEDDFEKEYIFPAASMNIGFPAGVDLEIIGTNHDIINRDNQSVYHQADLDTLPSPYVPTLAPEVDIAEHTSNVLPTILNALGVLVVVGIGIMAIFIGVKLIPRIIHKFF